MQTRPWIVACGETFVRDGDLRVTVVEDHSGVAAVAPLVFSSPFPPHLELLGARELSEPSDFVFRDLGALDALLAVLSRESTPLLLPRVPANSPAPEAIRASYRGRGLIVCRPGNTCPRIDLGTARKPPDELLSSRLRSDLRRAQRKAEAQGRVTYEVHAPRTAAEFLPLYEEALRVEAAGWKGRGGSAVTTNEMQRAFFSRYGALASEEGTLRLAFLRLEGVPAAMQYAIQWNGAFWLLKVGYDEAFSRCSPGMLLMQHTLGYAVEQGLRSYEFLGSAEAWTQRWTTDETSTTRIAVYPFGPEGMLSLGRDLLRSLRRKVTARIAARRRGTLIPEVADATPPSP
jgi:hypothetical protein